MMGIVRAVTPGWRNAAMEIGNCIRENRARLGMSQDDLAATVFCSRQTISSWENDKTYPDIQSLLLLSDLFGVTVDELIKGDVEAMEERIDEDMKGLWRAGMVMWAGLLLMFASSVWFALQVGPWGWEASHTVPTLVLAGLFWTASMAGAVRADRIKKNHDLVTYAEISDYMNGRQVDRGSASGIRARALRARPGDRVVRTALFVCIFLLIGGCIGYGIAALADHLA